MKFKKGDKLVVVEMHPPIQKEGGASAGWLTTAGLLKGDTLVVEKISNRGSVRATGCNLWLNAGHFEKVKVKPRDPLTIRKITCKSTGLPVSRVKEIKKKLREVYSRVCKSMENAAFGMTASYVGLPAKQAFEGGATLYDALGWDRQEEGYDYWEAIADEVWGAFK